MQIEIKIGINKQHVDMGCALWNI